MAKVVLSCFGSFSSLISSPIFRAICLETFFKVYLSSTLVLFPVRETFHSSVERGVAACICTMQEQMGHGWLHGALL